MNWSKPVYLFTSVALLAGCQQSPVTQDLSDDLNGDGIIQPYEDKSRPLELRAADLLSRLTPEQKALLVTGTGFSNAMGGSAKVPGAAGATHALENLGIPAIELTDGPAGVRINPLRDGDDNTYYATAFPIATTLASTWNPALVQEVGLAMGNEVKEYGTDIFLAPALNIQLNPLAGRNYEYFSEDPLLSGKMAAAIVNGVQANGVGATVKHFAANNVETSRMVMNAEIDEQALREIYLRGFEIVFEESQPRAVMSSYNKLNGTYTSQDPILLNSILRDEWGFDGLVMSDWLSGDDTVAQLKAGNDLIMPGQPKNHEEIAAGLKDGSLTEADLDKNVLRILKTILQSPSTYAYPYSNKPALEANAQTARKAAAEGVILLKNLEQTLPLTTQKNIAVFGNTSYDFISGGTGSGDVNEAYTVSLVDALKNNHFNINEDLQQVYQSYATDAKAKLPKRTSFFQYVAPIAEMPLEASEIEALADSEDIAFITLGRKSGEFQDRQLEGGFNLTEGEQTLIRHVSDAFHAAGKKVVVILNIGNVVETQSWKDKVDAIVLPWQGGQESGNAVVDVLTGTVTPSGKLAVTFPQSYEQIPSSNTFPGEVLDPAIIQNPYMGGLPNGQKSQLQYNESIYVGYRFFDTFNAGVSFPFGYGLSYTSFTWGEPELSTTETGYRVTLNVTNTGDGDGKDVVELYGAAPEGDLNKASQSLVAFAKTPVLAPGETVSVALTFNLKDIASFNKQTRQWVAEKGRYTFSTARSSRSKAASVSFVLDEDKVLTEPLTPMPPSTTFDILSPQQQKKAGERLHLPDLPQKRRDSLLSAIHVFLRFDNQYRQR